MFPALHHGPCHGARVDSLGSLIWIKFCPWSLSHREETSRTWIAPCHEQNTQTGIMCLLIGLQTVINMALYTHFVSPASHRGSFSGLGPLQNLNHDQTVHLDTITIMIELLTIETRLQSYSSVHMQHDLTVFASMMGNDCLSLLVEIFIQKMVAVDCLVFRLYFVAEILNIYLSHC